jgi:hypothetical protein
MMRTATRLQTLLANRNSLAFPPLDVSFIVIFVNVIDIVVATFLPTERASPPSPFPGSVNHSLASTQHLLEHLRDMNENVGPRLPPNPPTPRDNHGNNSNEDDDSLAIAPLAGDTCDAG